MDKRIKVVIGIGVFVLIMAGSVFAYSMLKNNGNTDRINKSTTAAANKDGDKSASVKAPDFSARDDAGQMVSLSSFFGKPTIISFWTTWCPNCRKAMPDFQKIHEEMGDRVNIVMVNATDGSQETETKARKYIKDNGYTFKVLYDINEDAVYKYRITGIPDTYFIDADGNIITRGSGQLNEELIKKGVDMIVK